MHARLRVEGLTDAESAELPVQIDGLTLSRSEISTWRTDAGALNVLVDMPDRGGHHLSYVELSGGAERLVLASVAIRVAGLEAIIESKEWADRPKDHQALPELYALRDRQGQTGE
jgi:hypothetical protein